MIEKVTGKEVAEILEKAAKNKYSTYQIAKVAYEIYSNPGRDLPQNISDKVYPLMFMDDAPEMELTEEEFREVVEQIKHM
ncbi:hypothetical protein [Entomobacter blattae]|uniref:Uncharacterized protein n=1 Tax=Entomobacter blattae TaxID=2762277 RepID=A0A7H1NNN3_9PROT|nr:hypothetical protein [Entomobacter blattae]QNT77393.1 hypothetical protein JGUZn3_01270 [Entomobacter blattae]